MSDKNWREWVFIFWMFAIIQWLILMHIATLFYAGGNLIQPGASGFSFRYNFFSDLGFCTAHSGRDNTVSCTLWFIASILEHLAFIFIAIAIPYFFKESMLEKRLSTIGSIFLIMSQIYFLFFYSVYNNQEPFIGLLSIFSLLNWLIFTPIIIILYAIALYHSKEFPNRIAVVFLIPNVFFYISLVVGLLLVGPLTSDTTNLEVLMFWAVQEKIYLYVQWPSFFYIAYMFWKKAKS